LKFVALNQGFTLHGNGSFVWGRLSALTVDNEKQSGEIIHAEHREESDGG
jgi:hypothetical protein